jgi:chromate transport protein ChrA
VERSRHVRKDQHLRQVAALFLRLGATAFGGPAAHIALIERECVQRRRWISREQFLDVLGVANLIPGPTSTELAMHVGRLRAGWPGLVAAGLAFILPAALLIGLLAALYVRAGDLPVARGVSAAIQPVAIVMVLQALVSIGPAAVRSVPRRCRRGAGRCAGNPRAPCRWRGPTRGIAREQTPDWSEGAVPLADDRDRQCSVVGGGDGRSRAFD